MIESDINQKRVALVGLLAELETAQARFKWSKVYRLRSEIESIREELRRHAEEHGKATCTFCGMRHKDGLKGLVLGDDFVMFCAPCGDKVKFTNVESGEEKTVTQLRREAKNAK